MKINKKIILSSVLIILTLLLLVTKRTSNMPVKKEIKIKNPINKELIKEEEYKGIKFTNISINNGDKYTIFKANIKNTTEEDIKTDKLHVSLKNKEKKEIVKLLIYIPDGLKKGETKTITATAQGNYKDIYSKEITD